MRKKRKLSLENWRAAYESGKVLSFKWVSKETVGVLLTMDVDGWLTVYQHPILLMNFWVSYLASLVLSVVNSLGTSVGSVFSDSRPFRKMHLSEQDNVLSTYKLQWFFMFTILRNFSIISLSLAFWKCFCIDSYISLNSLDDIAKCLYILSCQKLKPTWE